MTFKYMNPFGSNPVNIQRPCDDTAYIQMYLLLFMYTSSAGWADLYNTKVLWLLSLHLNPSAASTFSSYNYVENT